MATPTREVFAELLQKAVKDRDAVTEAEQIRRGIKMYLETKGLKLKQRAARKGGKGK